MTRAQGGIRTWLAAVAVAASTLLVAPTAAHASGAGTLAADVNAARASAGLRTLTSDGSLSAVAQSWANHMAQTDTLAHNPSTPSQIRSGWSAWGENVGFTTIGSASTLHQAFMASAGHRANILNRSFTSLGVGWATKNGHTYVAEVFAAYPQAAARSSSSSSGSSATKSAGRASSTARSGSSSGTSQAPAASSATSRTTTTSTTAPAAAPQIVHPKGLVLGDTGTNVRAMQVRLGFHGHKVRADGVFGPVTDRAVRGFQHDAGLRVDGIVGKRTAAALAKPAPKKATSTKKPAAAARFDATRVPLAPEPTPTTSQSALATPAALVDAQQVTTAASPDSDPGPSTAATLATLLTLAAALGAAVVWTVHRRRAG